MNSTRLLLRWLLPVAVLVCNPNGHALANPAPPAGSLTHVEGSVVFAPRGETAWTAATRNGVIIRGDRLWTDSGGRAELHLGAAVLHLDSEAFLELPALDHGLLRGKLHEGTLNARVRELWPGDAFEIATPHLALRALQPGDYRIDVDPARGATRITVRQGSAMVYASRGQALQLQAGQQLVHAGRELAAAAQPATAAEDGFTRWAAQRNWREDQALAARHAPRASRARPQPREEHSRTPLFTPAPAVPLHVPALRQPPASLGGSRGEADDPRAQWQLDQAQRQLQRPPEQPLQWPLRQQQHRLR